MKLGGTPFAPAPTSLARSDVEVTLAGAGRSGAQIAVVAAMLGFPLRIYDADALAPENQGVQLYPRRDVAAARLKVRALRTLVRGVVPAAAMRVHAEKFTGAAAQACSAVLVLAVDSMRERRMIWDAVRTSRRVLLLVDTRIGPGLVRVHTVRPECAAEAAEYTASLHPDLDAAAAPPACKIAESTAHAAAAAAALVGGALCAFVDGMPHPRWIAADLDRGSWSRGVRSPEPEGAGVAQEEVQRATTMA